MLRWLEAQIDPFERTKIARPPDGLWRFYWHFVRPVWPVFSLVLFLDLLAALSEVALAKFVADLIDHSARAATWPSLRLAISGR